MEYRALGNSNLDDGTVKGDRREAACMAWFPAGRELYPVSVKFKGDDGEVICVRNINISSSEDILYNGIASKQFLCNAVIGGLVQEKLSRLPKVGDKFIWGDFDGTVTRATNRRVQEVRLTPRKVQDENEK